MRIQVALKRLCRWARKLCRKPWYGLHISDDFESTEKTFWLERSAKKWVRSLGRDESGNWQACYAYMWSYPSVADVEPEY
jgi:hypothetical protein